MLRQRDGNNLISDPPQLGACYLLARLWSYLSSGAGLFDNERIVRVRERGCV